MQESNSLKDGRNYRKLEDTIDDVATNRCTCTENGSISQLLSELLAHLFALPGHLAFSVAHLADLQGCIAIVVAGARHRRLLIDDLDVGAWEEIFRIFLISRVRNRYFCSIIL